MPKLMVFCRIGNVFFHHDPVAPSRLVGIPIICIDRAVDGSRFPLAAVVAPMELLVPH